MLPMPIALGARNGALAGVSEGVTRASVKARAKDVVGSGHGQLTL